MQTDPRNRQIRSYVDGKFVGQYEPALPLFDSGFLHGKQVWSAPRLVKGRIFHLHDHLDKIRTSAELNHFPRIPSDEEIITAVRATLLENKLTDGVHIRIAITAGDQVTASMDVAAVIDWEGSPSRPRLIVMPEYRPPVYDAEHGIKLMTSSFKRPGPDMVNQRSHDNNQNASSRALFEAKQAGKTSALMFDQDGFLAETPASHVAIVKDGRLQTPLVRCCPPGVTRKVVLELCESEGISAEEADLSADDVCRADEIFLMGTMSGLVGAVELDGRPVGTGRVGEITLHLTQSYEGAMLAPSHGYDILA